MSAASATTGGEAAAERSALLNALVAALRREDFDEALRLSVAGLKGDSDDVDLQRACVAAHVRLGQITEALSFIEDVSKNAGEEKHPLQYEHAYVLYRLGMAEDALERIRNEDTSNNEYSKILEAQVLYRLGRPKEAAEAYIEALGNKSSKFSSETVTEIRANTIAAMSASSGDAYNLDDAALKSDEAEEFMRSEKCSARDSFEIGFNYASYLLSKSKVEEAQQFLDVAMRIGRDALELDDADEAEIEEELEPATIQLAYCKSLLGLGKEASEVYVEALKNKSSESVLYATTLNNLVAARGHSDVLDSLKRFNKLLPKGVVAASATTLFNPSLEAKLPDKLKAALSINRAILLVLCNKVNAARNLCVAIRESPLGSVGDMWQLTILVEASALVKAGKHKQAEELLGAQTNRCDEIVLMQAQVALAAKDLGKACSLLEELLRSNDGGKNRDHRIQETIIGTLADLFVKTANPQKAIETLEDFCGRDVEITAEGKQGALRLLAGLRRKHGLWSGANSCLQAMLESPHVQDNEKARLLVLSDLAEYYLHIEPEASDQVLSSLPPLPELESIDVDDLENNAGSLVTGRARADANDSSIQDINSSRGGRRRKKLTEKARQRKRLRALPKGFDPDNPPPPPDPERWIPKRERSANKAREKQKRRRESKSGVQLKGGQGAVRKEEMENLDISKKEVKEAPAPPPRLPARGGRRGKGKR